MQGRHAAPRRRPAPGGASKALASIAAGLTLALTACSDEPPIENKAPVKPTSATSSATSPLKRQWLEIHSSTRPAQWVLDWRAPKDRPASDEDLVRVEENLAAAHAIYRESERMIANRAVQLEQMLAKIGVEESAANILEDIASVAGEIGQTEGFGAVSQHYYILRSSRYDRTNALALLKSRYGTRTIQPPAK